MCITACAVPVSKQPVANPQNEFLQRQANLSNMRQWRFDGRIAVRVAKEGWQGGINWQQQEQTYSIYLAGPFGSSVARIEGDEAGVLLSTAEGEQQFYENEAQLMIDNFGWELPVKSLRYWILGVTDPQSKASVLELDDFGRPISVQQFGWDIHYQRYTNEGAVDLPKRLVLRNQSVLVKLVITDWHVDL